MKGAHFKSQLQGKVQLLSAPRGEERKAKITYSPYNKTIKGLPEKPYKKFKCSLFKRLTFLLKLFGSCSFTKPLNLQNLPLLHIAVIHFDPMSPSLLLFPSSSLKSLQFCLMGKQKSQTFLSSSPSRALSLILLGLCDLYSLCLLLPRLSRLLLHCILHSSGSPECHLE